jgi:hypothetical protein
MDERQRNKDFWKSLSDRFNPGKRRHLAEFRERGIPQVDDATRNAAKSAINAHNLRYDAFLSGRGGEQLPNASRGISVTNWDGREPRGGRILAMHDGRWLHHTGGFEYEVIPGDAITRVQHSSRFVVTEQGRRRQAEMAAQQAGPSQTQSQSVRHTRSAGALRSQPAAPQQDEMDELARLVQHQRSEQTLRAQRSYHGLPQPTGTPTPAQPQHDGPATPPGLNADRNVVRAQWEAEDRKRLLAEAKQRAEVRERGRAPREHGR